MGGTSENVLYMISDGWWNLTGDQGIYIYIDRLRTPAMPLDPWLEGGRQKKQQPSAAVYLGQESSNTEWQQEQEKGATCIEEKKSGRNREKEE